MCPATKRGEAQPQLVLLSSQPISRRKSTNFMEKCSHLPVTYSGLHQWHPPRHKHNTPWTHLQQVIMALWLLLLIQVSPALTQHPYCPTPPFGIQPKEVILEDKAPLRLNCTILPQHRDQYNSTDLYFEKNNVIYDAAHHYVEFPSKYQAVLYIPEADYNHFKGVMNCRMRGLKTCFLHLRETGTNVIFRRDPLMPAFNSCVVHNWERLECMWSPTRQKQLEYTLTMKNGHNFIYEFIYSVIKDNKTGTLHHCQCGLGTPFCNKEQSLNETCLLHTDAQVNRFEMGQIYDLKIHARTDRDDQEVISWKEQYNEYFNTSSSVKPGPADNLIVDNVTYILSWKRPSSTWNEAQSWSLIYNVSCKNQWNQTATNTVTSNTTFALLLPYTEYQVNITVKPQRHGYWSDVASITYTTPPVAPDVNPMISVMGYEYKSTCSHHCRTLLHWKPVKASEQNGPNFKYAILRRETSNRKRREADKMENRVAKTTPINAADDWVILMVIPSYNTSFVEVDVVGDMEITIVTRNTEGESQVTGNSMLVMEKDNALSVSELLIIEHYDHEPNNITVSLQGAPPSTEATYVLYWQEKNGKDPLDWYVLPIQSQGISTSVTMERDAISYRYGLGKIQGSLNSGIHWSTQPLYAYGGMAHPPSGLGVTSVASSRMTLHWNTQPVEAGQGYIMFFDIKFCSWLSDKHKCAEDHVKSKTVSAVERSVTLTHLKHDTQYMINITSVTRAGVSTEIKSIYVTTQLGLSTGAISGIAIAAIIIAILIIIGIYACWKKYRQAKKWYNSGIRVQIPEEQKLGAESVSSATPFLPYSYHQNYDPYNRSISTNSMDSGLSLDEAMSHDEMNGYARGGYVSSPTALRSIPEDTDVDDVFTTDLNNTGFVQSYRAMPNIPHASRIQNGYLSNQTSDISSQGPLDLSRSGISKYAAVAIDGQSDGEPANVCDSVLFTPGDDGVRLGSDDRTPSPNMPCTYTQVRTEPSPKVSHNPFNKAFWSANRGVSGKPPQGNYLSHNGGLIHAKARKLPRHHKHHNHLQNNGTFCPKTMSQASQNGYVVNDGTFDPQTAQTTQTAYVANDGTFNPKTGPHAPTPYVVNDGTFDPKSVLKAPTSYVANDGTFAPKTASQAPTPYVVNNGTFDPKSVPITSTGYVANDGTFDPKIAQQVPAGYVANDGTFDPNTAVPTGYVPNTGQRFVRNDLLRHPTGQTPENSTFAETNKPNATNGYVANDGTFQSNNALEMQDNMSQNGAFAGKSPHTGLAHETEDKLDQNSVPPGQMGYVKNDGTFDPSVASFSKKPGDEPDSLKFGTFGGTVLLNNSLGYLLHDGVGSVDSLNRRLSALGPGDECFDPEHAEDSESFCRPDPNIPADQVSLGNAVSKHVDKQRGVSSQQLHNDLQAHNTNVQNAGCNIKSADGIHSSQESINENAQNEPIAELRATSGRHNSNKPVLSMGQEMCSDPVTLKEHRKSAPSYINIHPDTFDTVDFTLPTSIACMSRQSGGFVTHTEPDIAHASLTPENSPMNLNSSDSSYSDCNGYLPPVELQNSEAVNKPGALSPNDLPDSKQKTDINVKSESIVNENQSELLPDTMSHDGSSGFQDNGNLSEANRQKHNGYVQSNSLNNPNSLNDNVGFHKNHRSSLDNGNSCRGTAVRNSDNNNVAKTDFSQPNATVKKSANPQGYIQYPLVADSNC